MVEGIRLRIGSWSELGEPATLVRDEVFVDEQRVPIEIEHDPSDIHYLHVLASTQNGEPVGTARLLPDGHVGRMAVRRPWRGQGVGGAMLALLIEEAREMGLSEVALNAQVGALAFYRSFDFEEVGSRFMEAGIEHQAMRLVLS